MSPSKCGPSVGIGRVPWWASSDIPYWAENGTLPSYIRNKPSVDRCSLSASICEGLAYLHEHRIISTSLVGFVCFGLYRAHSQGKVHGDLKGANVLVSGNRTPMLADFGNASLTGSTVSFTTTAAISFSPRWTAPEILDESNPHRRAGDVYGLGMTILEVFTGEVPFSQVRDIHIPRTVVDKKMTPSRPEDRIPTWSICRNILWSLLMSC